MIETHSGGNSRQRRWNVRHLEFSYAQVAPDAANRVRHPWAPPVSEAKPKGVIAKVKKIFSIAPAIAAPTPPAVPESVVSFGAVPDEQWMPHPCCGGTGTGCCGTGKCASHARTSAPASSLSFVRRFVGAVSGWLRGHGFRK